MNLNGSILNQLLLYSAYFISFCFFALLAFAAYIYVNQWLSRAQRREVETFDAETYSASKFIEIDGIQIHYFQEGRGPDLLLVHGIGASVVSWAMTFAELKKTYRVTAVDLPGFGRSGRPTNIKYGLDQQADRLADFIRALKIQPTFIIAHSMGGAIAAWMAKRYPDTTRKMILLAPALNRWLVAFHPALLGWFVHSTKTFLVTRALVRWVYLKRIVHRAPKPSEKLIEGYFRPYENSAAAVEVFWRHSFLLRDQRLPGHLKGFSTSTIILLGEYDRVMPRRYLKKFIQLNPSLQLHIISDCGHQIMEEQPDQLLKYVREFLI